MRAAYPGQFQGHPGIGGMAGPGPYAGGGAMGGHFGRHNSPSPGVPPLRLPHQPPPSMIYQYQDGSVSNMWRTSYEQDGSARVMHERMMQTQQEYQQRYQHSLGGYHRAFSPNTDNGKNGSDNASDSTEKKDNTTEDRQDKDRGAETGTEATPQHHERSNSSGGSPSPPPIPPPPADALQRASPAGSLPDVSENSSRSCSWGTAGPLRESKGQNSNISMQQPPKRMAMAMQPPPMHAQRPHPQHPNGAVTMNRPYHQLQYQHRHHTQHPPPYHSQHQHYAQPYINENSVERYRAMEQQQQNMIGYPHHQQHMKHGMYHQQQHTMMRHPNHPQQQRMMTGMQSPPGQPQGQQDFQQPPRLFEDQEQNTASERKKQTKNGKKGPDVTMDAASMLLSLRTSASPSTVASGSLAENPSQDLSEAPSKTESTSKDDKKVGKPKIQHDHDDLDNDSVPTLTSSSSSLSASGKTHCLPVQQHEVPKSFPSRLALPNDEAKLNSLHCFLRSELLEIFVVERSSSKTPSHSPGSSVGRVGLRCVFCAMARKRTAKCDHDLNSSANLHRDEAPMAVFYPKSIAEIYRLVTSWQRCHLRKCRNLPPNIRSEWTRLRENDKSRGKTHYWITSAKEIGLVDCQNRAGGIRFASPRSFSAASGSIAQTTSTDNESVSGGMYSVSHSHSNDDSIQACNSNAGQSFQPYGNPHHFLEGPSQKHREAAALEVNALSGPAVTSPMKVTTASREKKTTTEM